MSSVSNRLISISGLFIMLASTVAVPVKPAAALDIGQMIPGVNQALKSLGANGVSIKPTLEPALRLFDDSFNQNNVRLCLLPCGNTGPQPNLPIVNRSGPQPNMVPQSGQSITSMQRTQQIQSNSSLPNQIIQQGLQVPTALIQGSQPITQQLLQVPQQLLAQPQQLLQAPPSSPGAPMPTPTMPAPVATPAASPVASPAAVPGLPPAISSLIASGKITPTQLQQIVSTPQVQQFLGSPQGQQFLASPQGQSLVRMYRQSMMR
jgi:hypothetical protein